MSEYVTTVGGIFSSDPDKLPEDAEKALHGNPDLQDLHKEVDRAAVTSGEGGAPEDGAAGMDPPPTPEATESETADDPERESTRRTAMLGRVALAAGGLMAIGLYDEVFVKAWNEQQLFQKYTDPANYTPADTISVPLKEHKIKSSHQPKIEVRVNKKLVRTIFFNIELTMTLTGAEITIKDGKILSAAVGKCRVRGKLSCQMRPQMPGEPPPAAFPLADRDIAKLELVPQTTFEEPIPILPLWDPGHGD